MIKKTFFNIPFYGYKITSANPTATAVIFLHDSLGSTYVWRDFPKQISQALNCDVWVYDRKGHGKSNGLKTNCSATYIHEETEDLHRFIKHHNIQSPVLIGSSDGGTIAMIYASKYPTKAIVSLAGHYKADKETINGVENSKRNTKQLIEKLTPIHKEKTETLIQNWQNTWTSKAFLYWNICEEVKKISCPTLIIQGDSDEYASKDHPKKLATLIGESATYIILKNTGHFPHLQTTKRTLNLIINFLN